MLKMFITQPTCLIIALVVSLSPVVTAKESDDEESKNSISYIPLDPPFVVNFGPDSSARFLQVSVELGTRVPEAIELIKNNRPAIRNNLVFLFSDQNASELETREGKSKLRDDALNEARRVIKEEGGIEGIDSIYFTSFVMQ